MDTKISEPTEDSEPAWARVITYLYEQRESFGDPPGSLDDEITQEIANQSDVPSDEVNDILEYLRKIELFGSMSADGHGSPYGLTRKGFEVAHERSLRHQQRRLEKQREEREKEREEREKRQDKRQHEVNRAIGFLTLGLVFIGAVDTSVRAGVGAQTDGVWLGVLAGIGWLVLLAMGGLLAKAGMLAKWDASEWEA